MFSINPTKLHSEIWTALNAISGEYIHARVKLGHSKFNSYHEGISVIREEFEELWEQVKKNCKIRNNEEIRKEAIQTAAMVLAFIVELTE